MSAASRTCMPEEPVRPTAEPKIERITLSVDYGLSVEQMVVAGKYHSYNSRINSDIFSPPGVHKGRCDLEGVLVRFGHENQSDAVVAKMDEMGLCAGELYPLLALGAQYPEIQRQFPVVALGSAVRLCIEVERDDEYLTDESLGQASSLTRPVPAQDLSVPFLKGDCYSRKLGLRSWKSGWDCNCRFLAFEKAA